MSNGDRTAGGTDDADRSRYREFVEKLDDIVTVIAPDGTMTYVSPSVEAVLGYEPADLVGEVGFDYEHPDDRETVAEAIEAVIDTPAETRTVEVRFRHADGSWCWIEATIRNCLDNDLIEGILVNSRYITKRKRQEQDLRELTEEYEAIFDSADDAIFLVDVESTESGIEFRFARLSPGYEAQTGLSTEDVRGRTPRDVFGDERGAELAANYHRCVNRREPISYQEELPVRPDARIWQTNLAPVVVDDEVIRVVGIARNVTERVERERVLERKNERLDEFASVVSHDLRNPLNVATGRATLLKQECESDHLEPIVRSLDRMESIVEDTLALARQGDTVTDPEPVGMSDLAGQCWKMVESDAATLDVADEFAVRADRDRLRQVFENLFRNAVEHVGDDVGIRVGSFDDGDAELDGFGFYVADDGPGIPPDEHGSVFEPGYTTASDGTGFGLAIVNRVAEAHGWEVEITDSREGGTRFEFTGVEPVE